MHIVHCTENPIYEFPEMKLSGLVPKSYIHVSVSHLYIPRIELPIWQQQNKQTDPGNIYVNRKQIHECGNRKTEHYNSVLERKRQRSFISGNTIGTKHFYWILNGLSFAVYISSEGYLCTNK